MLPTKHKGRCTLAGIQLDHASKMRLIYTVDNPIQAFVLIIHLLEKVKEWCVKHEIPFDLVEIVNHFLSTDPESLSKKLLAGKKIDWPVKFGVVRFHFTPPRHPYEGLLVVHYDVQYNDEQVENVCGEWLVGDDILQLYLR